jgi:hypothetical protein
MRPSIERHSSETPLFPAGDVNVGDRLTPSPSYSMTTPNSMGVLTLRDFSLTPRRHTL